MFTLPCYAVSLGTANVETGTAPRGVAVTSISQTTTYVQLGSSAFSGGAVYAAVHATSGGPFYVSGTRSPFLGYFLATGALVASINSSTASKLYIYSGTLYASVGNKYGYFGTKFTLPTSASMHTVLLTHTQAINSFQIQSDTIVW